MGKSREGMHKMETRICESCKHMFRYIAGPVICPQCRAKQEELFKLVKEYLREHPGANVPEVTEATGVSSKLILRFLREGRLEVTEESPIALTCERCGKRILTGVRCEACERVLLKELNQIKGSFVGKADKEQTQARMRFLNASDYKRSR